MSRFQRFFLSYERGLHSRRKAPAARQKLAQCVSIGKTADNVMSAVGAAQSFMGLPRRVAPTALEIRYLFSYPSLTGWARFCRASSASLQHLDSVG
jgi:hypothetical protein